MKLIFFQCFWNTDFAYCVLLSCPYWNSICVLVFLSVKMGLMNDGIVPSKKSRAYFQSHHVSYSSATVEFNFLFGSLFIQCLLEGEKYVVQSQWQFWYWVSVQDQKNGRILSCLCWQQQQKIQETSSLTSIFFQHDGISFTESLFSKRFCSRIDNGRFNPF